MENLKYREFHAGQYPFLNAARFVMSISNVPNRHPNHRVLSVQSHVVSGYVGNKAAVFPLQLCGFDVDCINSVQFSNHTGYQNKWSGDRLSGEQLLSLIQGMENNDLLTSITHLLTGYIGSDSFCHAIVQVHQKLKACNPDLVYVCDPVLGDHGSLYVPASLVEIYVEEVIQRATILTPNAFELELLSKREKIKSEEDVFQACLDLHRRHGIPNIVVTSVDLRISAPVDEDGFDQDPLPLGQKDRLLIFTSEMRQRGGWKCTVFEVEKLASSFTGSGDLTAALILARSSKFPNSLSTATELAMRSVSAVLKRTYYEPKSPGLSRYPELKLIQSANDILNPPTADTHVWLKRCEIRGSLGKDDLTTDVVDVSVYMQDSRIFHLVEEEVWTTHRSELFMLYYPPDYAAVGFIHCCPDREALLQVANTFYKTVQPLDKRFLVIEIEEELLSSFVKYEAPASVQGVPHDSEKIQASRMPHIYGPINKESVVQVIPARRDASGVFLST